MRPKVKRYIRLDEQISKFNKFAEYWETGTYYNPIRSQKWKDKANIAMQKQIELSKTLSIEDEREIEQYYLCDNMF